MSGNVLAQGETNKWYFGNYAGLDFNTSPPTALSNGSINTIEGGASMSDNLGNLLFYTDGITVYNASHTLMPNGSGLLGNGLSGATQAALIAKQPGNTNMYYIFTVPAFTPTGNILYNCVDMNLSSGQGSVTVLNAHLGPAYITEQLTGSRHCNGTDLWILCRQESYTSGFVKFYAYLLTATGINTTAVVSMHTLPVNTNMSSYTGGTMKVSPNGKKLAVNSWNNTQLFDFDSNTGIVSNGFDLMPSLSPFGGGYGLEFSPDGSKLYITTIINDALPTISSLYQFDLCAVSDSAISASKLIISNKISPTADMYASLQLASNGKIYLAGSVCFNSISVIDSPNNVGLGCNFADCVQSIGTATSNWSLPNFMNYYNLERPTLLPATSTTLNQVCHAASFTSALNVGDIIGNCVASNFTLQSLHWDFGDPFSGSNTSSSANPTHIFSSIGTYTVKLIYDFGCGGGTDTLKHIISINNSPSCFSFLTTSITCANLGSATVAPVYNNSVYSYTWMPGAQTGTVATGLVPGIYTLFVHDSSLNTVSSFTINFAPLIPLTGNVVNSSSVSCYGANTATASIINLSGGSGAESYLWINPNAVSYTTASTTLSAGLWNITVTDALTGCQINQVIYITQPPITSLTISASSSSVCLGENIVLTGTSSGGVPFTNGPSYNYTWTAGPASATRTVNAIVSGTYVYTLASTDANNCLASTTVAVNFVPNPTLSISSISICPLAVGVLTVSGATSYTWYASTTPSMTGSSFPDSPLVNTQYTVIGSAIGCTASAYANIILKQVPPALISSNSPECNGENITLTGFGANNFLWSGPNNFTSAIQIPTLTNVSLNNAGVYTVIVTAANSCTNSATHTVVVYPSPTVSALGSTVCTSQTLSLSANSNATLFAWNGPQGFNSPSQNPSISSPTLSNSGTYTVKVTDALGCSNSTFATVSVIPPPSLTGSLSSNGTLCAQALNGSPNTITLTSGGANTYTLFTPYHLSNNNPPAGPSYSMASLPPFNTGPATATLMGSNGVCSVSLAINFSIVPNPTLAALSPTPIICAGETFTYTSNGASSYTWVPNSPNLTTYTSPVTVASPTQTSVYSVVGGSLGCYSGTQTSTITVRPLPQFSLGPIKAEICLNDKIDLTAIGNAESYTWLPYNGLSSVNGFTVSAGPLSQQTYTILGVLNTCTTTAMITVSVLALPVAIAKVTSDKLCVNGLVSLHGEGGVNNNWEGPLDLKLGGTTATFVANSVNYSGTYILTVTDTNGCKNKTSVDLTIYNSPGGNLFTNKQEACIPFTSDFKSTFTSVNVIGSWVLENRNFTTKNFSHQFTTPGTYTITGNFKDTLTTCVSSTSFVVRANPNPIADFSFLPEKPIENLDEVIFTNTSLGDQQTNWNWYFINNKGDQSQSKNTSHLFSDAGTYPVVMVVSNTWGCKDTAIKTIKVEADLAVYVPNVFTPNGDELNDVFIPVTRALKQYELSIFDRWGAKVFVTTNSEAGWDGTFRGEACKVDVYVWKIVLSSVNGEMKTLTGHVTLSR